MGSHKMKLVTGLTLVSVAFSLGSKLEERCLNADPDYKCDSAAKQEFADKCANEELVEVPISLCHEEAEDEVEEDAATVTTIGKSQAESSQDSFLTPRNGGQVQQVRTWVDDVHEYCRVEKHNCKHKKYWGFRVVDKLSRFQEAMDERLRKEAADHYDEYMRQANQKCFVKAKHCQKPISKVSDVEIPAYNNFWKVICVECFVTAMRAVSVHAGDTNLAGMDNSNCLGRFCQDLRRTEEQLLRIENDAVKHGEKHNALSAEIRNFKRWRVNKKTGAVKNIFN